MIEHVANDDWLGIDFLFFVKSCNANSQRDVVGVISAVQTNN